MGLGNLKGSLRVSVKASIRIYGFIVYLEGHGT